MSEHLTKLEKRSKELNNLKEFAVTFDKIVERRIAAKDSLVQVEGFQIKYQRYTQGTGYTYLYIEWAINDIAQPCITVDFAWLSNWYNVENQWLDVAELVSMINCTLDLVIEELAEL